MKVFQLVEKKAFGLAVSTAGASAVCSDEKSAGESADYLAVLKDAELAALKVVWMAEMTADLSVFRLEHSQAVEKDDSKELEMVVSSEKLSGA